MFPYGKEDTDYNIENNPSSGYVFNGATSVFWCRLRDLCSSEIRTMFNTTVRAECFSATHLINQFDQFQECFPEEIWRLDIQRKYIRTFTGESIDNSKPKHDVQYLRDMMQGRKKYQRRQWVRDQEIYFGTMNLMNTVVGDDNRITFRCFTPTGDDIVVEPDYTLHIKPYSDMYLSVMFGNGGTQQIRAKGGTEYTIECPLSTMDDTQVTIYCANRIQELSDLSACYIAANNFSMATKLRKLVLGNTTEGYNNSRLVSLTLGNNKLLEELDIRNCGNLAGSLNLSQSSNLLKLYAEGTKITGVTFATNGKVRIAHLPSTINTLIMRNLNDMVDFDATLNRLDTLTLEGGTLNSLSVVTNSISTLNVLYLYGIDWTVADTTILNAMANMFYSLVTGSVYISGAVRNQELVTYGAKWHDLEVTYNPANMVTQYLVTYVNADNENTVLYTTYVDRGSTPPDPYELGLIQKPTLASDAQYSYDFGTTENDEYVSGSGWSGLDDPLLSARTVTAVYTATPRTYTVTWYSRAGLPLGSTTAHYGDSVEYTGDTPTNESEEGQFIYNVFKGWDKSTGFIRGDTNVYALWERDPLPAVGKDMKDMSYAEIYAVTKSGNASTRFEDKDYKIVTMGNDFEFSNVESEVLAQNLYLDGSTQVTKNITLFGENSPSFTLAIDFRFTNVTDNNNTLVACFEEDGSEGFRLRFNTNPDIQWGDQNVQVGYKGLRDIVVLRHRAGENKLYVYSSNGNNTSYAEAISKVELTRSRPTQFEQKLTLGAIRFMSDGGFDDYGSGYIYWAKIWYDDLGDANATELAQWPHIQIPFEYYGTERYRIAGGSQKCSASFIANCELPDRTRTMNATNTNAGGWEDCQMRKNFIQKRFPAAFPQVLRSMIKKVKISATAGSQSTSIVVSEDFVYLAAVAEVSSQSNAAYVAEGSMISWYTSDARRAKFMGIPIPDDATYYTDASDPTLTSGRTFSIGDVWKKGNNNTCYIYADEATIRYYGLSKTGAVTASISGYYWISATNLWLRSPSVTYSTNFWFVSAYGNVGNSNAFNAYAVCPCFSI